MLRTSLHLVFLSAVFVLSICGTCGLSPGRRTTKTLFTTTDSLSAATTLTDPGHQTHAIAPVSLFSTESDASVGPSPSMPRFQAASLRVDPCQPGFQFSDGECKACLPGSASPNGTGCVPCASGFYATLAGAPSCLACASGSVSGEWSTGCTQCGSGMIATSDHTKCIECPPGTWSRSGDTVCRECPVGTFNSLAAMPGCVDCGPGSYNPKPGSNTSSDCILCPGGSACTDSASSFPTPCDDTHYASAGAAECVACPKMFVSSSSRDSCQPTGVFYFVLACVLALVGLAIACVIQCPKKEWTAVDSVDPVL